MKKILSLTLAALLLVSMIPTAMAAENNWQGGTKVEYTATANEQYTVTVPATLAPGAAGDVVASGTWGSNRKLTVTADKDVTLTNSINAADQKVLDVTFAGIELTGSNTESVSDTKQVAVASITDAIFGTWSGTFNYNVAMSDVAGSGNTGDSGTTEPSDPDTGNSGSDELNPDDGTTPSDGDVYTAGDYKYTYSGAAWNGWKVSINENVTDKNQTTYGAILESINGKPITNLTSTFQDCTNITEAPVIPETVTNMNYTFKNCTSLTGSVEINVNPTYHAELFAGVDFEAQNLTLIGTSTMLDTLGETGTNYCDECDGACQNNH